MPFVAEYLSSYSFDPKDEVCSCLRSSPDSENSDSRKRKLYTSSSKILGGKPRRSRLALR